VAIITAFSFELLSDCIFHEPIRVPAKLSIAMISTIKIEKNVIFIFLEFYFEIHSHNKLNL
jgi:hypothetical protein